jgi:hypothetical protein
MSWRRSHLAEIRAKCAGYREGSRGRHRARRFSEGSIPCSRSKRSVEPQRPRHLESRARPRAGLAHPKTPPARSGSGRRLRKGGTCGRAWIGGPAGAAGLAASAPAALTVLWLSVRGLDWNQSTRTRILGRWRFEAIVLDTDLSIGAICPTLAPIARSNRAKRGPSTASRQPWVGASPALISSLSKQPDTRGEMGESGSTTGSC